MNARRIAAALIAAATGCAAAISATNTPVRQEQVTPTAQRASILVMLRLPPQHYRPQAEYGGSYGDAISRTMRERVARRIARDYGLALLSNWPMPLIGLDCFVMTVPTGKTAEDTAAELSRDRRVEWSQPMQQFRAEAAGPGYNDPLFPAQPAAQLWRLPDLHQLATGRGVTVAVIDSKIDASHSDLAGQLSQQRDFLETGSATAQPHGTEVAGIIAAKANNRMGIVGVAPRARLMGLNACWQEQGTTMCNSFSLAKALHYAIDHHADVINLSLAGPHDRLLAKLLQAGLERGGTIVAAYDEKLPGGGFPASLAGVIAVSDQPIARARPGVYTAPGKGVPTTQPGGRWILVNGSSFAAAHVSGLLALTRERQPGVRPVRLTSSARGEIDACGTLIGAKPCDCACAPTRSVLAKSRR